MDGGGTDHASDLRLRTSANGCGYVSRSFPIWGRVRSGPDSCQQPPAPLPTAFSTLARCLLDPCPLRKVQDRLSQKASDRTFLKQRDNADVVSAWPLAVEDDVEKLLLTPDEAADALGIGRSKLYQLMRSGTVASVRIGSCRRIPAAALPDLISQLQADAQDDGSRWTVAHIHRDLAHPQTSLPTHTRTSRRATPSS